MPLPRGKFNGVQRSQWREKKQQEGYSAAESKPLETKEKREAELSAIQEFIKNRGVTKVSVKKKVNNE